MNTNSEVFGKSELISGCHEIVQYVCFHSLRVGIFVIDKSERISQAVNHNQLDAWLSFDKTLQIAYGCHQLNMIHTAIIENIRQDPFQRKLVIIQL